MNQKQFDLVVDQRFPRLSQSTVEACRAVIFDGVSSYSAEDAFKCGRGTVSRYVTKIHAEWAFCEEVANHAKS